MAPAHSSARRPLATRIRSSAKAVASDAPRKPWQIDAELSGGYDSNVLLQDDSSNKATGSKGWAASADLRGTWRFLDEPTKRLSVQVFGHYDDYPDQQQANLARIGAAVIGQTQFDLGSLGAVDPGVVLAAHRLWLDSKPVASVVSGNVYASRLSGGALDVVSLGGQRLVYDHQNDASGFLWELAGRHWWLVETDGVRSLLHRFEFSLRAARFAARSDAEAWMGLNPMIGAMWRFGDQQKLGTVDASVRVGYEFRWYDQGAPGLPSESQRIATVRLSAACWTCAQSSVGPYVVLSNRDSNISANDFSRTQAGLRLTAQW